MSNLPLEATPGPTPVTPPPPLTSSRLRQVFFGADGLRAGWSLLIFVAIMAALIFCSHALAIRLHALPQSDKSGNATLTPFGAMIDELFPLLSTFFATWIMSKIEKRPTRVYGLGGRRKLPYLVTGLVWGILLFSLLVFTLCKAGLLVVDARLLFGEGAFRSGAIWLFDFMLVGMLEEYLTRGYLLFTLTRGIAGICRLALKSRHSITVGFWTAAILLSFLFGLGHHNNPGESPIGLLSAGLASMVFCLSLWRTGSLWWAIGFHTAWDWSESFLYGTADSGVMVRSHLLKTHPIGRALLSGGTTGPEGSIFILAILALIVVIILFTLPREPYAFSYLVPGEHVANED